MNLAPYEIKSEMFTNKEGKEFIDLVCYVKGHRFVLAPVYSSKKAKAYFYSLLMNTEKN